MLWAVVVIPFIAGIGAIALPHHGLRRALLLVGSLGHAGAVGRLCFSSMPAGGNSWVALDEQGALFLGITSILFLAVAIYAIGYLKREAEQADGDTHEELLFGRHAEAVFVGCLLLFLATMSLVCISRHLGLLWVAVEATTLVSAPLIGFHRQHRSLEAMWKYLLICSVGIALSLLGNFFLAFAAKGHELQLTLPDLVNNATRLNPTWLKAAFLLLLVGYGTKMGLAPMHTWLPDAHSEAPSMVSALLSGALLNCAFLGILRGHAILVSAGFQQFSGDLLVLFGLLSMGFAALFLIRQVDYKRMLAYSSIEHMGILALGVGVGGFGGAGALLHAVNHSLTKGMLFLIAGNLLAVYKTKNATAIRGLLKVTPVTGCFWLIGFLAITGSPPFGLFLSELTILKAVLDSNRWGVAIGYLLALGVIFVAMARIVLPMVFGLPQTDNGPQLESVCRKRCREPLWAIAPAILMGVFVLVIGFYLPPAIWSFLESAAASSGGF